jgi:alkylhydroperoxidase/carboxymuconolactone decarboxylase family protein YurZ
MYLPEIFKTFQSKYPEVLDAYRKVGDLSSQAGPLNPKTQHLIQLGVSIGLASPGGVRSHARRALDVGATDEEVLQTVLVSSTLVGFPSMIAAFGWVREVLTATDK